MGRERVSSPGATPAVAFVVPEVPHAPASRSDDPLAALARAAAAGDARATSAVVRALAGHVRRVVRGVLGGGHADLDDVAQVALIGLVQAMPAYRGDGDLRGYARVIAIRAAIAHRRRARAAGARVDDAAEPDALPADRASQADDAGAAERMDVLRGLLADLPAEQAETLALRVVVGCSLEEVARATNVPVNTVRSRLRLAKERLKAAIAASPRAAETLCSAPGGG